MSLQTINRESRKCQTGEGVMDRCVNLSQTKVGGDEYGIISMAIQFCIATLHQEALPTSIPIP